MLWAIVLTLNLTHLRELGFVSLPQSQPKEVLIVKSFWTYTYTKKNKPTDCPYQFWTCHNEDFYFLSIGSLFCKSVLTHYVLKRIDLSEEISTVSLLQSKYLKTSKILQNISIPLPSINFPHMFQIISKILSFLSWNWEEHFQYRSFCASWIWA